MIEPLPAIILIHEWWGLDDNVKSAADRLAAEGYIVLAVDLFAGRTADDVADARTLMLEVVENQALASANIQQAVDFVADTAGAPTVAGMPEYLASMALSGLDGTLRDRLRRADLKGKAHLKTGSLDDVAAIAGYLQSRSGRRYVLAILHNHPDIHRGYGEEVQEALIRWLHER